MDSTSAVKDVVPRCRFNIPFFPMKTTQILGSIEESCGYTVAERTKARADYVKIRAHLDSMFDSGDYQNPRKSPVTFEQFLHNLGLTESAYVLALRSALKGPKVFLRRAVADIGTNNYCPKVLDMHRANMDIQYIVDAYSCVSYIVNYINKSDKGMSKLMSEAEEHIKAGDINTKQQLRKLANIFLKSSELSIQEAAYHVTGLRVTNSSCSDVFVQTFPLEMRVRVCKGKGVLRELDPSSTDVYVAGMLDRYVQRPDSMEAVCLARYATEYTFHSKYVTNAIPLRDQSGYVKRMSARGHRKILRYRNYGELRDPINFYRENLMLYVPFRDEQRDLIRFVENGEIKARYLSHMSDILREKREFVKILDDNLDELADGIRERRRSQLYNQLFATSDESNDCDVSDHDATNNNNDYVDDGLHHDPNNLSITESDRILMAIFDDPEGSDRSSVDLLSGLTLRLQDSQDQQRRRQQQQQQQVRDNCDLSPSDNFCDARVDRNLPAPKSVHQREFYEMMATLNYRQSLVLMRILSQLFSMNYLSFNTHGTTLFSVQNNISNTTHTHLDGSSSNKNQVQSYSPLYLFVSGGAGVGKSHLIKTIEAAIPFHLDSLSKAGKPLSTTSNVTGSGIATYMYRILKVDKRTSILCAPTGKAAYNIGGGTIHSAFKLPVNQYAGPLVPLSKDVAHSLWCEYSQVKFVIIDEISMVGSRAFHDIDSRLRQIMRRDDYPFGGVSIIVFGDFRQLPPVGDSFVFSRLTRKVTPFANIIGDSWLWGHFRFFELIEVMRQRDDASFATALTHLAERKMTKDDIQIFESRHTGSQSYCGQDRQHRTSTSTTSSKMLIPRDAICLFRTNAKVEAFNNERLKLFSVDVAVSDAVDVVRGTKTDTLKRDFLKKVQKMPVGQTFGLALSVPLHVGARYMVTVNTDMGDGMVHGACGILKKIQRRRLFTVDGGTVVVAAAAAASQNRVDANNVDGDDNVRLSQQQRRQQSRQGADIFCVWLDFTCGRSGSSSNNNAGIGGGGSTTTTTTTGAVGLEVGKLARQRYLSKFRQNTTVLFQADQDEICKNVSWVPVTRCVRHVLSMKKHSNVYVERKQFPLIAAEGMTIHKSQGATYPQVALCLEKWLSNSHLYVACSRVTKASGLFLYGNQFVAPTKTRKIDSCDKELQSLRNDSGRQLDMLLQDVLRNDVGDVVGIPKTDSASRVAAAAAAAGSSSSSSSNYIRPEIRFVYHNVQSYGKHQRLITSNPLFYRADVACFVETWLLPNDKTICFDNFRIVVNSIPNSGTPAVVVNTNIGFSSSTTSSTVNSKNNNNNTTNIAAAASTTTTITTRTASIVAPTHYSRKPYGILILERCDARHKLSFVYDKFQLTNRGGQLSYIHLVRCDTDSLSLYTVYIPSTATFDESSKFLKQHVKFDRPLLMVGDFNVDFRANSLLKWFLCEVNSLTNLIGDFCTTMANTAIDWCLTNVESALAVVGDTVFSHHKPIVVNMYKDRRVPRFQLLYRKRHSNISPAVVSVPPLTTTIPVSVAVVTSSSGSINTNVTTTTTTTPRKILTPNQQQQQNRQRAIHNIAATSANTSNNNVNRVAVVVDRTSIPAQHDSSVTGLFPKKITTLSTSIPPQKSPLLSSLSSPHHADAPQSAAAAQPPITTTSSSSSQPPLPSSSFSFKKPQPPPQPLPRRKKNVQFDPNVIVVDDSVGNDAAGNSDGGGGDGGGIRTTTTTTTLQLVVMRRRDKGLQNIDRVSCYANSAVNCLLNLPLFVRYIEARNSDFDKLFLDILSKRSDDTVAIRRAVSAMFAAQQQQDCQEFLVSLMPHFPVEFLQTIRKISRISVQCRTSCESGIRVW